MLRCCCCGGRLGDGAFLRFVRLSRRWCGCSGLIDSGTFGGCVGWPPCRRVSPCRAAMHGGRCNCRHRPGSPSAVQVCAGMYVAVCAAGAQLVRGALAAMRLATMCLTRSVAAARSSTVCVGVSTVWACQLAARASPLASPCMAAGFPGGACVDGDDPGPCRTGALTVLHCGVSQPAFAFDNATAGAGLGRGLSASPVNAAMSLPQRATQKWRHCSVRQTLAALVRLRRAS